jgi:DNA-binding response OmpR family regulator
MLNDYLRKRGCEIALASSCKEVQRMLRERHYDLVLSEFMLFDGTAYQFMACLRGTDATMFFFNVVEHGCWWINAVSEGQDHSDDRGMRPAEFRILLDEILFDRLLRNAKKLRRGPRAHRCDNLAVQVRNEGEVPCEEPILVPSGGI